MSRGTTVKRITQLNREQQSPCVAAVTAHYSEHRRAADVPLKII